MPKAHINFDIPLILLKEGDIFVCMSPALDLVSHGDSYEDAVKSFRSTLSIFFAEIVKMGTLEKVLLDCGWQKIKRKFVPPQFIGEQNQSVQVAV